MTNSTDEMTLGELREEVKSLHANQTMLGEIMSCYLANTQATCAAMFAVLEGLSGNETIKQRLGWHLEQLSDSNLKTVRNPIALQSFEEMAANFRNSMSGAGKPSKAQFKH
ncbi:hypothetical protein [Rhodoferax mekongensis]|uniref:hypothetical protein n=1 Tax=Rhodoferax mekongensis TaxID=3068341 RepID=UPI0028BF4EF1|nr:hypothetical protein [Rhodoferax sp. TBRC 17199]MDT7514548.1 hypothetical protein [Rhodoferax sp. TBRC 17199]